SGILAESLSIQEMFVILGSINLLLLVILSLLWFRSLKEVTPVELEPVVITEKFAINGLRE
ncbi:MAG: hypothetical protein ACFFB3_08040, partial [Candidatus Hodarchaeota archaeon]